MSQINDGDLLIRGIDNTTPFTALTFDMSEAGAATFNAGVTATRFDATTSSTTDPVLSLTDYGVADYDFTFPDTSTIQLGVNTTSDKTFKLLNSGSGTFNLNVEGSITGTLATAAQPNITSTGTLNALGIAGNLTVDTNTFHVDASNNRVGIGTTSPAAGVKFQAVHNVADEWIGDFKHTHANAYGLRVDLSGSTSSTRLAFGTYTGGGTGFFVRNDGLVGIGTTSPTSPLTVHGNLRFNTTSGDGNEQRALFNVGGSGDPFSITGYKADATTVGLSLSAGGDSYFNGGNVGIGMTPNQLLDLNSSTGLSLRFYNSGTFKAGLQVADSSGQMIGTSAANDFAIRSQSNLLFSAGGNTEAMRVLSSDRRLCVAKTSAAFGTVGHELDALGQFSSTADGRTTVYLNRLSSHGKIIQFHQAGTEQGSINTKDGDIAIGTGDTGLRFIDGSNAITPHNITGNAGRSDQIDLGTIGARFKDIYAGGGIFLSGTGASNRLENFQDITLMGYQNNSGGVQLYKGSTLVSSSYNARYGYYARVGNLIFVSFYIYVNSGGCTASGEYRIYGIPFNLTSGSSAAYQSIQCNYLTMNGTNIYNSTTGNHRWQANSTTYLSLYGNYADTNWTSSIIEFAGSGVLYIN